MRFYRSHLFIIFGNSKSMKLTHSNNIEESIEMIAAKLLSEPPRQRKGILLAIIDSRCVTRAIINPENLYTAG